MANRANIQKRRFEILDTLLKWEGELSNSRIRDLLDIQVVSASRLLADYREAYPDRLSWDSSRKRYLLRPNRERFGGAADDYLRLLTEQGEQLNWIERLDTNISVVQPAVLSTIRRAIQDEKLVQIDYASMTHPEGQTRDIFPFHIVEAGRRWHVRAWCCMRGEYRDFVLGRIRSIKESLDVMRPSIPDTGWETRADVRLVPHSALSPAQARVIRDELLDGTTARRIRTRACLVPYVVQEVRASVSIDQQPPDYQIEVANLDEIRLYLFP
ncbi:MAG TPA: WYL domain-containing protein [Bellilinea sp.]|nr:WYL domain-containing protein [Bellilinea sp.]